MRGRRASQGWQLLGQAHHSKLGYGTAVQVKLGRVILQAHQRRSVAANETWVAHVLMQTVRTFARWVMCTPVS